MAYYEECVSQGGSSDISNKDTRIEAFEETEDRGQEDISEKLREVRPTSIEDVPGATGNKEPSGSAEVFEITGESQEAAGEKSTTPSQILGVDLHTIAAELTRQNEELGQLDEAETEATDQFIDKTTTPSGFGFDLTTLPEVGASEEEPISEGTGGLTHRPAVNPQEEAVPGDIGRSHTGTESHKASIRDHNSYSRRLDSSEGWTFKRQPTSEEFRDNVLYSIVRHKKRGKEEKQKQTAINQEIEGEGAELGADTVVSPTLTAELEKERVIGNLLESSEERAKRLQQIQANATEVRAELQEVSRRIRKLQPLREGTPEENFLGGFGPEVREVRNCSENRKYLENRPAERKTREEAVNIEPEQEEGARKAPGGQTPSPGGAEVGGPDAPESPPTNLVKIFKGEQARVWELTVGLKN